MSSTEWLDRLNQATEYRELRLIFSEIAAEARRAGDGVRLASSIDEAIRRIERERLRDQEELRTFEQEYEAFKQQQNGVVGWFKRHLPFTETRRQEKQHLESVADQKAEVLLDNLFIARAQMLKEQILPPEQRRLGRDPSSWRQRFAEHASVPRLRDYAADIRELASELAQSRAFVTELEGDIQAVHEARFADAEDRRYKDADLMTARNELAELRAEIQSEQALRAEAVKRLGGLVEQELSDRDPSFRLLVQRTGLLETASGRATQTEKTLQQVQSAIKGLHEVRVKRDAIPAERDKIARKTQELRVEADAMTRQRVHAATILGERRARAEMAQSSVERAKTAADAAQKAYQTFLAQGPEISPGDSFSESPAVAEHATRTQRAMEEAQQELRAATAAQHAAQAEVDRAEREVQRIQKELEDLRREEDKLSEQERTLRGEWQTARDQLRPLLDRVEAEIREYVSALSPLERTSSLREILAESRWRNDRDPFRSTFGAPASSATPESEHELRAMQERYQRWLASITEELKALTHDLNEARRQRQQAWGQRGRELLGDDLAAEACRA